MNPNDQAALILLAELQRLAAINPTTGTAARVTIRSANGEYLGDVTLTHRTTDALTDAVSAMADYAEAMPADFAAGRQAPTPPGTDIDPLLAADFAEYCIGLPVDELVAQAAQDPHQAVAAFDEITAEDEL